MDSANLSYSPPLGLMHQRKLVGSYVVDVCSGRGKCMPKVLGRISTGNTNSSTYLSPDETKSTAPVEYVAFTQDESERHLQNVIALLKIDAS